MVLLGKNLAYGLDVMLGVIYPVCNVLFGFWEEFALREGEKSVLGVLQETIFGGIDAMQFRFHVWREVVCGFVMIGVFGGP